MRDLPYDVVKQFRAAITNDQTHAVVLLEMLNYMYGEESQWLDFDPVTIYMDLKEIIGAEPVQTIMDRIGALQVVMVHNKVFTDPSVFVAVSETIADGGTLFGFVQDHTVEECGWTIVELAMMRDLPVFGYHVKQYILNLLEADGYTTIPEIFQIVLDDDSEEDNELLLTSANEIHKDGNIVNAMALESFIQENMIEVTAQIENIPVLDEVVDRITQR